MMNKGQTGAKILIQNPNGSWVEIYTLSSGYTDEDIRKRMIETQRTHKGNRVKATTLTGSLIDIM